MKGAPTHRKAPLFSLIALAAVAITALAGTPMVDVDPPTGIEFPAGGVPFVGPDGSVVDTTLTQVASGLLTTPIFIDADGNTLSNTLDVAPDLLHRPVFLDPDGNVTIPNVPIAPGLLFRDVFIDPDGSLNTTQVDPPPDLEFREVFISPEGQPVVTAAPPGVQARRIQVRSVTPNPFNPATEVRFQLQVGTRVRVAVHDLRGRLVRTLHDGRLEADLHAMRWDGKDDAGRAVASGSYVFRVIADGEEVSVKGTLVK